MPGQAVQSQPVRSRAQAHSLLQKGQIDEALRLMRERGQRSVNAENRELDLAILRQAADALLDRNQAIDELLATADAVGDASPTWQRSRAEWLARAGRLDEACKLLAHLADPNDPVRLTHALVDQSIRSRSAVHLPREYHSAHQGILKAFQHYERGEDEQAREALQAINLSSPFLDWKVFLRGMIAFANGDSAKAIENWQRLAPHRLAYQLAAPFRLSIDRNYKSSLSDAEQGQLRKRLERLTDEKLINDLRLMQRFLSSPDTLGLAFTLLEDIYPHLLRLVPEWIPRLRRFVEHSLVQQGGWNYLARLQQLLGPSPDDPHQNKLKAQIAEISGDLEKANQHWGQYEAWLASSPPGWPPDLLQRARAIVLFQIASNGNDLIQNLTKSSLHSALRDPLRRVVRDKFLTMVQTLKRVLELAPDWDEPVLRLVEILSGLQALPEARTVVEGYLSRHPEHFGLTRVIASLCDAHREFEAGRSYWLKCLKLQPLDRHVQQRAAEAVLRGVRLKLRSLPVEALEQALAEHRPLLEEALRPELLTTRAILAARRQDPQACRSLSDEAIRLPNERSAAAYRLMAEATWAGLPPAMRNPIAQQFQALLDIPPTPGEATALIRSLRQYIHSGLDYRGLKTHEKLLRAQVARCITHPADVDELAALGWLLQDARYWKELRLLALHGQKNFPTHPLFFYHEAAAMHARGLNSPRLRRLLDKAWALWQRLPAESQTPRLRQKLEHLRAEVCGLDLLFDNFIFSHSEESDE